jgi:hypothetical protein
MIPPLSILLREEDFSTLLEVLSDPSTDLSSWFVDEYVGRHI